MFDQEFHSFFPEHDINSERFHLIKKKYAK